MAIVILYSLGLTIYAQWPRFRKRWVWGMLIFYLGLLLMLHARMFDQLGRHSDFWNQTWSSVTAAVLNDDSSMPIGGSAIFWQRVSAWQYWNQGSGCFADDYRRCGLF